MTNATLPMPLHHVGIVLPDEETADMLMALLALSEDYRGYVPEFHALCIFTNSVAGGSPIEFVIADGGPLLKFNKGAGGIHHVAFTVPDLAALQAELETQGVHMIQPAPVKGAGNFLCNFLSPVSTRGVIVEYVQLLD